MKIFIAFAIIFCLNLRCIGQNQGSQKVSLIRLSADDTVSFTPTSYKDTIVVDSSISLPRMKTSAFDDDENTIPVSKPIPNNLPNKTNVVRTNSENEEEEYLEKSKVLPQKLY
jgi:hypothetical protein